MQRGELLLLELNKVDAGIQDGRTNFVLVLDRIEEDDGTTIQQLWPNAKPGWRWLLYGSATIPTIPFSLDDANLDLSKIYGGRGGQNPAPIIKADDEEKIERYILRSLAEIPDPTHQLVPISQVVQEFEKWQVLWAIDNHDRIVRLRAGSRGTASVEKCEPNSSLAEILSSYYEYRCQICGKDRFSDDGVAFSEAHHIQALAQGGLDISTTIVILCPNHRYVIEAMNARFDRHSLAFAYPNGLREPLILRDHFEKVPQYSIP